MGEERDGDARPADRAVPVPEKAAREGRLDLSVPQVAGSAVAAVVAAKLASNLGVYGTILGAGVVSALGTCGGTILQHVFRRTGRQVQVVAVQARPAARRARTRGRPVGDTPADGTRLPPGTAVPETARTRAFPEATDTQPGPEGGTRPLTEPDGTGAVPEADRTRPFAEPGHAAPAHPQAAGRQPRPGAGRTPGDGYGAATSYRAARRGWKRPVAAVALAFGLTMAGITGYEAIAGENISGHGHGTTIGNAVTGHAKPHSGDTGHSPPPGGTATPPGAPATGPRDHDASRRPSPDTTPSAPRPSRTPPSAAPTTPTTPTTPATPPPSATTPDDGAPTGGATP